MVHRFIVAFVVIFVMGGVVYLIDESEWGQKHRTHMGILGTVTFLGSPVLMGVYVHVWYSALVGLLAMIAGVLGTDAVVRK